MRLGVDKRSHFAEFPLELIVIALQLGQIDICGAEHVGDAQALGFQVLNLVADRFAPSVTQTILQTQLFQR